MLENCVGSFSSTPRIRNSKKPSRTHVRSWKHQWLLLCPVKLRKIVGVVHPTKFRRNLRVFWKLMNPQECVWEIRYRIIMKTRYHLQIAWLRWTSSTRSIGLYPSKNGRCSQIIENSQIGVSRHLDSSTTTQMAKIMVQYGRPSRSS